MRSTQTHEIGSMVESERWTCAGLSAGKKKQSRPRGVSAWPRASAQRVCQEPCATSSSSSARVACAAAGRSWGDFSRLLSAPMLKFSFLGG